MAVMRVRCPHGHTTDVMKHGVTDQGKPRSRGQHAHGPSPTGIIDDSDPGRWPALTPPSIEMARKGSGRRERARVRKIRQTTVMET
jgi:hypothetical protein